MSPRDVFHVGILVLASVVGCGKSREANGDSGLGEAGATTGGTGGAPSGGSAGTANGGSTTGGSATGGSTTGGSTMGGAGGDDTGGSGGASGDAGAGGSAGECEPGELRCVTRRERCSDAGAWVEEDFVCATDIAGSSEYFVACAVKADGALTCFGRATSSYEADQLNAGKPARPVVGVDVGDEVMGQFGVCAIEQDGYLTCWGTGSSRFENGARMSRVAAFGYRVVGLDRDGHVVTPGGGTLSFATDGTFLDIAADHESVWAIRADGGVVGGPRAFPSGSFVQIAATHDIACAVSDAGRIVCDPELPVPSELASAEFVRVAVEHGPRVCAIRVDGTIACYGGDGVHYVPFEAPAGRFVDITSVYGGMCGIRSDGSIHCWSSGGFSALVPPEGW